MRHGLETKTAADDLGFSLPVYIQYFSSVTFYRISNENKQFFFILAPHAMKQTSHQPTALIGAEISICPDFIKAVWNIILSSSPVSFS